MALNEMSEIVWVEKWAVFFWCRKELFYFRDMTCIVIKIIYEMDNSLRLKIVLLSRFNSGVIHDELINQKFVPIIILQLIVLLV